MPIWSLPLLFLLLAMVLLFGNLSLVSAAVVSAETVVAALYILAVRGRPAVRSVANVLPLLPVNLLMLFGLSRLAAADFLASVWAVIPAVSVAYDAVTRRAGFPARTSILVGLYGILWADVFFLLDRWIAVGRGLTGRTDTAAAVAFGVVWSLLLLTGIRRHRDAAKE
jgi:hypothetical protein